jgi:hypothetical protein
MPAPLSPEVRDRILVALRAGATRPGAAAACRIGRRTLYDWLKDEEFAASVAEAEAWFEAHTVARLRKAGEEAEVIETFDARGKLVRRVQKWDWRALAWLLERSPSTRGNWAQVAKAEITGPQGGPIALSGAVTFTPDPAWLAQYAAALAELPAEVSDPMLPSGEVPLLGTGETTDSEQGAKVGGETTPHNVPEGAEDEGPGIENVRDAGYVDLGDAGAVEPSDVRTPHARARATQPPDQPVPDPNAPPPWSESGQSNQDYWYDPVRGRRLRMSDLR